VRVESPNPLFAKALQQAIGGIEGEIRVAMQYMFQDWGVRGDNKYREMLLNTGAEELGHIEMLSTAVALNLENAPLALQEEVSAGGPGRGCHPERDAPSARPLERACGDAGGASGVPFEMSHIYARGNIAADMYANVTADRPGARWRSGSTT
jgi:Mn-containing catalase